MTDRDVTRGFEFYPGTIGSATLIVLARQPTDGPIAFFIIDSGHIFGQDWNSSASFASLTYDPNNTFGFGNDTLIIGDNGVIVGGVGVSRVAVRSANLDISFTLLGGGIAVPGTCAIQTGNIGIQNGASRPDHAHQISTSALGTPSAVGLIGARGTSIQIPRFDHVHKALAGTVVLINADETQINGTIPNVDTAAKIYTLAANTYSSIIAEAEGYIKFVALSVNQQINIKIKFAGAQVGQTMALDAALGANSLIPFPIKASGAFAAGGQITVTVGAAAADANTTAFFNSLRVYGVV